jgi:hypothetical protein
MVLHKKLIFRRKYNPFKLKTDKSEFILYSKPTKSYLINSKKSSIFVQIQRQ